MHENWEIFHEIVKNYSQVYEQAYKCDAQTEQIDIN